jgi:hypothetical protein
MKTLTFFIGSLCWALTLHAQIIHVPADKSTIQAGINAASTGDTVLVAEGTYLENINFMGKAITVASHFIMDADTNHINNTVIDGSQPANPDYGSVVTFISGEDTTSVISGFTITGGAGTLFPVDQQRVGGGILCYNAGATIKNNMITSNQVDNAGGSFGGGVAMNSDGSERYIILKGNEIKNNDVLSTDNDAYGGGVYSNINVRITENLIAGNSVTSGTDAWGGGVVLLSMFGTNQVVFENNIINNNTIEGNYAWGGGVAVYNSAAIITGNQIINNAVTSVKAWGGGILIQGTIGEFYLTHNEISGNSISASNYGVGMGASIQTPTANAYISGNEFSNNTATGTSYGGGFRLNNNNGVNILVDGNVISDNDIPGAGGGVYTNASNCRFVNNLFANNSAGQSGGGIFMEINQKDALFCDPISGSVTQDQNIVRNNSDATDFTFINNTFAGNSAGYYGGAIRINYTTETCLIMNSVFWENDAVLGDDIHYSGSDTIHVYYSNVNLVNIFGLWAGQGNIDEDPLFDLSGPHPYALLPNSPCIDTGTPDTTGLNLPPCDIMGCVRIWDGEGDGIAVIDMGAYEFGAPLFVGIPQSEIENRKSEIVVYPNPFHSSITIEFELLAKVPVTLQVYNHLGQMVAELANETLEAGIHRLNWDSSNLPTGIYYFRLITTKKIHAAKIIKTQ